jgi:hypothetical protein
MIVGALRRAAVLLLLALLLLFLVVPAVGLGLCVHPPPAVAVPTHSTSAAVVRVGGLRFLRLTGSPAERGHQHGRALAQELAAMEGDLLDAFVRQVPGFPVRHLLLGGVGFHNRRLDAFLHDEERQELAAAVSAAPDAWRFLGPAYQRAVNGHALHDLSQQLIDSPLVHAEAVGCAALAINGPASSDGHLWAGRIFDFEAGPRFDEEKVVFAVAPKDGLRYLHIGWAGMTGIVTGLNEAGLWLSINAGATTRSGWQGRPIVLAAREILANCRELEAAVAILRRTPVFVSSAVLLASRADQRAVVAEIGPTGVQVREAAADGRLLVTNHFQHPGWRDDAVNAARQRDGSSSARLARLTELSQRPLDRSSLVTLLRDRRGPGDRDLGFLHRGTLNAWIAAHAAIADVTAGVLWVSEAPHGLGAWRAFDHAGPRPEWDLPADAEAVDCRQRRHAWLTALREGRVALAGGDLSTARRHAAQALALNPQHYDSQFLAGLAAETADARRQHLTLARDGLPAYAHERAAIAAALAATP